MSIRSKTTGALLLIAAVIAVGGAAWLARGSRSRAADPDLTTQAVERHDITLTVEASGTVEPVNLVEIKSKASGNIIRLPVSVGSRVAAGDLLVQIDARDVQNQYDQALAARQAAQVKVIVSSAQKARADSLFAEGIITAGEHEAALLDMAGAEAALTAARTNLDIAKVRLEDATVRAPGAGVVLSLSVAEGQVISSATSSASGGTTLLTMADLNSIRMRALVAEADVGNVSPGQTATVTVDAFPSRTFEGTVEKVEPQAVVQQSVTNFPVLVSLANEGGLLLPGMNGEVALVVDHKTGVLAVPADAVRSQREALVLAASLGLDPDAVRAALESQKSAARARKAAAAGDSTAAGGTAAVGTGGVASDSLSTHGGKHGGKHKHKHANDGSRDGAAAADGSAADGSSGGGSSGGGSSGGGSSGGSSSRSQVVFVKSATGIEPRRVKLGLSDFDFSQVTSGVEEGEQVVMLGLVQAQAARVKQQAKAREKAAGSMPGGLGSQGSGSSKKGGGV